ncbi:hypothetical protein MUN88_19115 [Gracilibacillus caseinilyticus]|uniref:DUF3941 domain-containing protein n=1 Tax=Gracilibacillus caseinilyticus TaxID=2932256 RepID=A0ABY4EUN8_9BACI|nr:hypothetical protein [Gracilibacillus caseinilyticus]UOQ48130.1 hypothetical protein MUN88_19115 [Gracilibacillus caseinilyticus]
MAKKKRNNHLRSNRDIRKRKSMSEGKNWTEKLLASEEQTDKKLGNKRKAKDGAKRLRNDHN